MGKCDDIRKVAGRERRDIMRHLFVTDAQINKEGRSLGGAQTEGPPPDTITCPLHPWSGGRKGKRTHRCPKNVPCDLPQCSRAVCCERACARGEGNKREGEANKAKESECWDRHCGPVNVMFHNGNGLWHDAFDVDILWKGRSTFCWT